MRRGLPLTSSTMASSKRDMTRRRLPKGRQPDFLTWSNHQQELVGLGGSVHACIVHDAAMCPAHCEPRVHVVLSVSFMGVGEILAGSLCQTATQHPRPGVALIAVPHPPPSSRAIVTSPGPKRQIPINASQR